MSTSRNILNAAAIAIALAGAVTISTAARAETGTVTHSLAVSYAHLDLGNSAAVETLFKQLAKTAERACGPYERRDLRQRHDWRECRDAAFGAAVARVVETRIATLRHESVPVAGTAALAATP
jgi:UrcA family protein